LFATVCSHLRNTVMLHANDYISDSGCAAEAQSLFSP
jgi:hypothetical protein